MEEGVEEEVGIGDTNMLEILLVELVGIVTSMPFLKIFSIKRNPKFCKIVAVL